MIRIKSYILFNKKNKELDGQAGLELISNNPSDFFVEISDPMIGSIDLNGPYIDGAIIIEYNYTSILSFRDYDLIDQLWTYLIQMIQSYLINKEAEIYFPDQPRRIKIKESNGGLVLYIDTTEFAIKKNDVKKFLLELTDAGRLFFVKLSDVKKDRNYKYQLENLERINNLLMDR